MHAHRSRRGAAGRLIASGTTTIVVLTLIGCARYRPAPLALVDTYDQWAAMDAVDATRAVAEALPPAAAPAAYDLTDGISIAEAEAVALFFNPQLRALRLRARIPEAAVEHARLWEDPELAVDGERVLEDAEEPWAFGAGLALTIPLSGRPAVRRRLAAAEAESALAGVVGSEWALVNRVRGAWLDLAGTTARRWLIATWRDELRSLADAAEPLVAAKKLARIDARALTVAVAQSEADLREVASDARLAQLAVLRLLGLHPHGDWALEASVAAVVARVPRSDQTDDFEGLLDHPNLREVIAAYAVSERALELEVRKQYPDLTVGFGAGSDEGASQIAFGFGLVPIPLWNRNRGGIAAARAERAASAADAQSVLRTAVHDVALTRARLEGARERLDFVRDELAPQADAQLLAAKRLARLGELDVLMLLDAVSAAHDARLRLLDARLAVRRCELELAALLHPPGARERAAPPAQHDDSPPATDTEVTP